MVTTLVQQLKTLIESVNQWDKAYKKGGAVLSKAPNIRDQKKKVDALRASLFNSIKAAHAQEEGVDNDFAKLEEQMHKMEAIQKEIKAILKTKDLGAAMIFMPHAEYDRLDAFRTEYFNFKHLFNNSELETQDVFGKLTNEYDQRAEEYYHKIEKLIGRIGIMADSEEDIVEDTTDTIEEDTTTVDTTTEDNSTTIDQSTETSDPIDNTSTTAPVTTATTAQSSDRVVNGLLELHKTITPIYNEAAALYTPAKEKAGNDLIILTMSEHDQVYTFNNQYEDFNWKFEDSTSAVQQEFEALTQQWAATTKQLFQDIQDNHTQIKITEQHSNRLVNPKPTVNHNVVDQLTGEDPELGSVYQKTDRFVRDEEGRQYSKKAVEAADLFKKGADDRDSSGIDPYDIIQGALGNCYFMCSLSAIANAQGGPQKIKDMITANSDGTFTVKLYRPINKRTQAELKGNIKSTTVGFEAVEVVVEGDVWYNKNEDSALYARSQDENEMWPLILEKAYAKLMGGYDEIDAGFSEEAYAVLTGTPRRSFEFSDNSGHAISMLVQAAQEKKGVTFATPPDMAADFALDEQGNNLRGNAGELIMLTRKEDGGERIVAGHAYALDKLVGDATIDANGKVIGNAIVHLINPHGKNHIKKLPLQSLPLYFSRVVVDY